MKTLVHLTLVGSVLLGAVAVASATCLKFDGANDYVEFDRPVSGDFTIECWLRSTQVAGSETQWWQGMGLVDGEVSGLANDFGLTFGNGRVLFGTGNPDTTIRSTSFLTDGKWHHVAATREQATGTLKLFVDGVLDVTGTGGTQELNTPPKMRLGSLATALYYFQGELDEVRLWNTARSDTEIATSWNRPLAGSEAGLVAYYPMEEGTGTTLTDASGHGVTGTLWNGVLWDTAEDAVGPLAVTELATSVSDTSAQLNALVKPGVSNLLVWFEWGSTTNYTSATAATSLASSLATVPASAVVTGLNPGSIYHYRAVGSNSFGVFHGADRSFTLVTATSLADSGPGSLRQIIADAVPGTIIRLTNSGAVNLTGGDLWINKDLVVAGPGAANLAISGSYAGRVFHIEVNVIAHISGLTIRDGRTPNGSNGASVGAAGSPGVPGGGIYNAGQLTLSQCVVTGNATGNGGNGYAGSNGGDPAGAGGAGGNGGPGGGIYNAASGVLILDRCTIRGNATGNGGTGGTGGTGGNYTTSSGGNGGTGGRGGDGGIGAGICADGKVTLDRCTINGNDNGAGGNGGTGGNGGQNNAVLGIHYHWGGRGGEGGDGGTGGSGGGLFGMQDLVLINCTISANTNGSAGNGGKGGNGGHGSTTGRQGGGGDGGQGGSGGGVYNSAHLALMNSTITYGTTGSAGAGGALGSGTGGGGTVGLNGTSGLGGGIRSTANPIAVQIANTIIALNTAPGSVPDDASGTFFSQGHNLLGTTSGSLAWYSNSGDLLNTPPLLGALTDNGGPTLTHALWPESPAVNGGDNAYATFATDQRGSNRLVCAQVDIGAFEYAGCPTEFHPAAQRALYFDGVNDYVDAGTVGLSNSCFTIEAWAKRDTLGTGDCILGQGTSTVNHGLFFAYTPDNRFTFAFYGNNLETTNAYTDSDWHHWAGTYDTNTHVRLLYRDGVLVASNTSPVNYLGTGPLRIGSLAWGSWWFDGELDEVRVWNVVRTPDEIADYRYRALRGTETGLIAYYRFDGTSIGKTRDSVTGFEASLMNGPVGVLSSVPLYQPIVTTLAADSVRSTTATFHGMVNPAGPYDTTAWFEYGKSLYFGNTTDYAFFDAGLSNQPVSFAVTNLESGTRYYVRLVAANAAGLVYGDTITFDTLTVGNGYPITTRANNGQSTTSPRHVTDAEGNIYLAGTFSGSVQFKDTLQASGSPTNAFLAELARRGDWRWAVNLPVTDGLAQINALALDGATNVIVAGSFTGTATFGTTELTATNGSRAFLARFEPGATNWTWAIALGSGATNSANALAVGGDGRIYVAGEFSGVANFGTNSTSGTNIILTAKGGSDAFVARYNSSGQADWATQAGGTGGNNHDAATALVLGPFGEMYVTGFFMDQGTFGMNSLNSAGGSDLFFAALSMTNGLIQRAVRAGASDEDRGTALTLDSNGNIYLVAQLTGAANFNGASLPDLDASGMNLVVARLNDQGVPSLLAAARDAYSDSIVVAPSGRIYLTGDFTGAMRYGPTLITIGSGASGNRDVFLAELLPGTSSLIWAGFKKIGGIGTETRGTVSVDPAGSVVVSGTYAQSLIIGYVELTTSNPQEIFLARLDAAGIYEHNLWEIGQALIPPDEALQPPFEQNRAKGLPGIEILESPEGLQDSSDLNAFSWNDAEKRLYAIRPVTARIKWPLSQGGTNMANVATMVGRCVWPDHPQTNVAGVPVEVEGPGVGRGFSFAEVAFNTNGASVLPVTRGTDQFLVFQTATNASGYNVVRYTDNNKSVFDVVLIRPYGNWATNETRFVGAELTRGNHQDSTGKNGYVFFERSFYDAAAYDRNTRTGPIIPVNRNLHNDANREMAVVWYRTNALTGVAWGSDPVRYTLLWPPDATKLVIASAEGAPAAEVNYPQAQVYHQSDPNLAGFNPNEEHALILNERLYALRSDLNNSISPKASEPYVLLKYLGSNETNDWRMKVFQVLPEDATHKFANFTNGVAGFELQVPAPLSLLPLCGSSNRIAFGQDHAHQAWTGKIYAKSAGYLQIQYWYQTREDFYFGPTNPPVGSCVPWMSRYNQANVSPGATHTIGEPVLVGYQVAWSNDIPVLHYSETLTSSKAGGLPDLLNFSSARVIYDDGNPDGTLHSNSLVRIFDPLSERTIQLPADFKLPDTIAKANDRGRLVFTDLPYPLRIRLFYDELNQRLSFGGWYDPDFGNGEPLLLPNILSPRERDRIKQLDGTDTVSDFDRNIDLLYDLTRNPNQVDVDRDTQPDQELRAGLITQIRDGTAEILIGPVIAGLETNFVTYTTNFLSQPVSQRVTNVIQEQFGELPKALTAGLRPESGYVTIIENDDPTLAGRPINLYVIYVTNSLYRGDLKVLPSDNVFDERLSLRHSGDFGGEPQNYEFEWYYQPDQDGVSPPFPDLASGHTNWNGWIRFPTPPSGTNNGVNDVTLGEGNNLSSLLVLSDNWLLCRYRGYTQDGTTAWSDWVGAPGGDGAMLAEGWVKRVLAGLNEFDSRTKDFHESPAATYASMILQAGERYEGPIAFNPDPNYLNSLGLIESYETVLARARNLSIDAVPPVNFGPANNALLRAAGKIADLYMLLGNEAYADASDPTIGFTTSSGEYGNLAPSIFCFQNQLDSPLEEELALLRGRDDSAMSVRARPVYNRLLWNFTLGEGEVAYKLTYNISDQNADGFINENDARILYPQGHGDAWGHYLTAITKYYELLRQPHYEWVPRPEAVTVAGSPVQVDYLDERKFAQAAAAKARAGTEIVNLTYREKYVADPAGQWQGYKDTDSGRAWGVSEWATRSGMGAYFDWVTANAILPATDPATNHVGIQKIDRITVTELSEIPAQFAAIEGQLDSVDRGLNPLGLAVGAMPFDIDPSKVAAGETHFDQIYARAVKAMENTLALFDYVNTLSQSLRHNQDDVDQFTANVDDQERDYKNRMIEIFGYPYAGDIGPAGTYPSGYDGPDIYHYMYVDAGDLTGDKTQPNKLITAYYKPFDFQGALGIYFPNDVKDAMLNLPGADGTFHVSYPLVENGSYQFAAPNAWAARRAPGKIQNALSEMLKARAQLNQGLVSYNNLREQIQDEIDLLAAQTTLAAVKAAARTREFVTVAALTKIEDTTKAAASTAKNTTDEVQDTAQAGVSALPTSVGTSTDPSSGFRGFILKAAGFVKTGLRKLAAVLTSKGDHAEHAKLILQSQTDMTIEIATGDYELKQQAKVIEQLYREEAVKRVELYTLQENVQQAYGAYLSVLAEGQRLMEERYNFRVKAAAQVQEYRYQDMAFRIFQNDALQKYRAQFDLAARYVYLAAKAYDYETCLLNTETGAGSKLLTDIVRQRTLGQLVNGLPVSGRHGLADPLARLGQNFEVYRGQLGFTTPETETGRFSLRSELFRVRPGDLQTNALNGLVSTNQDWNALLQKCRVPDLWKVPEFRRFCRPFAPESAGPQPGLIIRIPTTITFGLNYFGWPLGPGDSAYDSSRFATKVRSAGVWFSDYNLSGLSQTPRVYLVPAGTDILRSPSSYELETREFNVVDQKLPVPFPIGSTDLSNPSWIPANDSLSETFGDIRRFSSFRAYHDQGWFDESEATQDTRLIGRSVWNSEWLLIIPGGTFLYDPDRGLDTFIDTVGDIKIFFQTYSYSGN